MLENVMQCCAVSQKPGKAENISKECNSNKIKLQIGYGNFYRLPELGAAVLQIMRPIP